MNKIHCPHLNVSRMIFSLEVNGIGCLLNDVSNLCARDLCRKSSVCVFKGNINIRRYISFFLTKVVLFVCW